ncbi:hypothetical protein [Bacteroides salyersiae]|uniref:hypothetical protein n=1 Tax=Bacteroides salyersiae TaxID=291644 RepID=UPI0018971BEC|nr:hypothetical protein [Bacteroides salyersiae]
MIKKIEAHNAVFDNLQAIIQEEQLPVCVSVAETRMDENGDKQVIFCLEFDSSYENQVSEALNKAVQIACDVICNSY